MTKRMIIFVLIFTLIASTTPIQNGWAAVGTVVNKVDLFTTAETDQTGVTIIKGQENVPYTIGVIKFPVAPGFVLQSSSLLNNIKVYAGSEDETYKFDIGVTNGYLQFKLKTDVTNTSPYQLRKHTLYLLSLPEGLFAKNNGADISFGETFSFVTNNGAAGSDILKNTVPYNTQNSVDYKNGKVIATFIDNVAFWDVSQIGNYITISTKSLLNSSSSYISEPLDNFNIQIIGNSLNIDSKDGKFKDLTAYQITLKEKTVYLTASPDVDGKIFNDTLNLGFATDNIVASTKPLNNGTNEGLEPVITFQFKQPVIEPALGAMNLIKLEETVSGAAVAVTRSLSADKKTLSIAVQEDVNQPGLKKDTSYRVTIPANTFTLDGTSIVNKGSIMLNFRTGSLGDTPMASAYGSNESFTDDIRDLNRTQLGESGYIYIKMNRPIQWDKDWDGDTKKTDRINGVELYKMPAVDPNDPGAKAYAQNGIQYDKKFWYMNDGANFKLATTPDDGATVTASVYYKEKTAIESIEIVGQNKDILRIKAKFPLNSLNQYQLRIKGEMIEDLHGVNTSAAIDFYFWTKGNGETSIPSWGFSDSAPYTSQIISTTPYIKERIVGTSKYSPSNPISISFGAELIPAASEGKIVSSSYQNNALGRILLRPVNYTENKVIIGTTLMDASPLDVDTTVQFTVAPELNPTSSPVSWITKNGNVATVDGSGRVKGISKGQTQLVALDNKGNILATVNLTVKQGDVHIGKVKIIYEVTSGGKQTLLRLYPNQGLTSGKSYKLFIPGDVFQTRGKTYTPPREIEFVVAGDISENPVIESIDNGTASIGELLNTSEHVFYIKGYNFEENIKEVRLVPSKGGADIVIGKAYITYLGADQIKVSIKGAAKTALVNQASGDEYQVVVHFDGSQAPATSPGGVGFKTLAMGSPNVIAQYPVHDGTYNEQSFVHGVSDSFTSGKYFLRITFSDPNGTLNFNGLTGLVNIMNSSVVSLGSQVSMIDTDFINQIREMGDYNRDSAISKYLLVKNSSSKEAILYIPVKPLRSQTTYQVILRPEIVGNSAGYSTELQYLFHTNSMPYIGKVDIGSVPQNYDINEPIILKGDFFDSNTTKVYFNEISAYSVSVKEEMKTDGTKEKYLEVYLPRGSSKLSPGIYNIKISSGSSNENIEYGAFSVVSGGNKDSVPNEDFRFKQEVRQGDIKGEIKVSQDTLYLNSRYTDDSALRLDLDDLMGQEVWIRKISYKGDKRDVIGILETKSKWANITLYGLTLDPNGQDDTISIALGRTSTSMIQSIQKKLKGSVKSDFIQVTGENFKTSSISISIPFKNADGKKLKVYRYDENTRGFYEINAAVDVVNGVVKIASNEPGIFVAVE
ncbi:Ig-like domain-containing protein [Anaerosolibacter sp.]|uniref:Ig-like domain-containing protein n=1 Tax=Anaerosolibacter sp. TaxID=1872527 RepID=UPI0026356DC5|nr:Ig-like domain-containing protein [Anaerosolibacter sp.]